MDERKRKRTSEWRAVHVQPYVCFLFFYAHTHTHIQTPITGKFVEKWIDTQKKRHIQRDNRIVQKDVNIIIRVNKCVGSGCFCTNSLNWEDISNSLAHQIDILSKLTIFVSYFVYVVGVSSTNNKAKYFKLPKSDITKPICYWQIQLDQMTKSH